MKPEKVVQKEIMDYVKANGGYVIKIIKGNTTGIPDLIIAMDGLFIGCEVKAERFLNDPEAQMSLWQHKHKNMIKESGALFICCATLLQFEDFINNYVVL
jgi:hypothetical protein